MGESFWQEGFKIHLMNMDVNYKFLDTQKNYRLYEWSPKFY